MTRPTARPYAWMLLGSLSFAVMGSLAHALGGRCGWPVLAVTRAALPLAIVATVAVASGTKLVWWRPRTLWVRSLAGSIGLVSTFFALTRLPVSDVFTLTNLFPVWVAVLSWPLLAERPSAGVWLAVASGVLGVVLIQQPHLAEGNYATLVALASSLTTAVAMLGLHRLRGIDARAIVVHFSAVALVFALACCFLFDQPPAAAGGPDGETLILLLGLGGAATVGQLCLTKAFTTGPPAKVSVVGLSQVVFALGLDWLIWHRPFDPLTLAGTGLVLAPTAWLLGRRPVRRTPAGQVEPQTPAPVEV